MSLGPTYPVSVEPHLATLHLLTGTREARSTHPEFYEEEGVLRALSKQLLQATFLFRKFVIYLTNVHRFEQRVTVRMVGVPNVHEEVFVVLQETIRDIPIINFFIERGLTCVNWRTSGNLGIPPLKAHLQKKVIRA